MIDDLIPILVPASIFLILAVVAITKIISDGRTRRRLIDAGASPELAAAVLHPPHGLPAYGSLRWGLLIGAVGLGLVVVHFLPYDGDDPLVVGVILVFAALGLVAHYAVGRRLAVPGNRKTAESLSR